MSRIGEPIVISFDPFPVNKYILQSNSPLLRNKHGREALGRTYFGHASDGVL